MEEEMEELGAYVKSKSLVSGSSGGDSSSDISLKPSMSFIDNPIIGLVTRITMIVFIVKDIIIPTVTFFTKKSLVSSVVSRRHGSQRVIAMTNRALKG